MIGLDTNVLVRYLSQDDPTQSACTTALIDSFTTENPGYIPLVSLVELVWVMQSCYQVKRVEIVQILRILLGTKELIVENPETAIKALRVYSGSKADFSECLIERSANRAGCDYSVSFDTNDIRNAGFQKL